MQFICIHPPLFKFFCLCLKMFQNFENSTAEKFFAIRKNTYINFDDTLIFRRSILTVKFRAFSRNSVHFRVRNSVLFHDLTHFPLELKKRKHLLKKQKSCSWICLHHKVLSCTWTCLNHRGLSCTWTCLDSRVLDMSTPFGPELRLCVPAHQEPLLLLDRS